jgi:ribosomal protein S18 acetylase RimI-like enzyme
MPDIRVLVPHEWQILRDVRLTALTDAPDSFLARYADEVDFDELRWRAEFERGEWSIGCEENQPLSLLGCTREETTPRHEYYLEYLWVSPGWRRRGVGYRMLVDALDRLRKQGVRTAHVWVLDGNFAAAELYRRVGFVSGNRSNPLPDRPGRSEELMRLDLD